jgi:hypothetical protein
MQQTIGSMLLIGTVLIGGLSGAQAAPDPLSALEAALTGGAFNVNLRLRYEAVEQDNALDDAEALTLRTVLGYTTQPWNGLSGFVEMENVDALVDDYSGIPPPVRFSVVPDPGGTEVNQWGVRYTGIRGVVATAGRSKLILDNARWVGNVGWRQNEQTYDGTFIKVTSLANVTLNAAYITNVNSIFFSNIDLEGTLLNAQWVAMPALTLTAYAYLLDYSIITAAMPAPDTLGLRANGGVALTSALKLSYVAEFARQEGSLMTGDFAADYLLGELALGFKGISLAVGYEVLGSDGGDYAVQTPLATLHAHNGWNDLFLVTPLDGLQDTYFRVSGSLGKVGWMAKYHEFSADEGSADYGSEFNVQVTRPLVGKLSGGVKYGAYSADTLAVDTDKLWVWLGYAF